MSLLLTGQYVSASSFGKNKVQYTYFEWKYLTTEHFNIYYSQGGRKIADFTADVAEDAYRQLSENFHFNIDSSSPITLLTYQSHNDFEQTNVSGAQPQESVGGFTEFLKSRVVVPYEGNLEKYRHVIHHELTHAMMLNMLYGEGFASIVSGLSQSRTPLWFIEGLAEFQSRGGLDRETEMFLRDAVVNDFLPEVEQLNGYGYLGVYKSGQSILYWIAWRYGNEKVGELLHQLKVHRDFNRALKSAIGIDQEELSKRWRRFIKERYWPQMGNMDPPDRNAIRLTDHRKEFCFLNNSPSLSPNGEWIAFLSDRSDYFDVYLMSTLDGKVHRKLVHGQRSGKFEEMHWLRPGITWSPDGERIAFCAKAGGEDALFIINVNDAKVEKEFTFGSDGLFSPSWSPDGKRIALVYVKQMHSDIAIVDLETGKMNLVTNDVFDDADPSWSPDSKKLLFTSNRNNNYEGIELDADSSLFGYEFDNFDIFLLDIESSELQQLTNDDHVERTPVWTHSDDVILYTSDRLGTYNLYFHNIVTGEATPVTNVVTGAFQPTVAANSNAVAFTSYYDNGYDIYLMNDPFNDNRKISITELPDAEKIALTNGKVSEFIVDKLDYSEFVFDRLFSDFDKVTSTDSAEVDSSEIVNRSRTKDGDYDSHDYKVSLTPDMVFVNAGYSPYLKMQGLGMMQFSDVFGNHNLSLSVDIIRSLDNSNLFVMYQYTAHRINYGGGVYHYAYPFYSNRNPDIRYTDTWRDRNWGIFLDMEYPFTRYSRVDFGLNWSTIERSRLEQDGDWSAQSNLTTVLPRIGYIHDTSIWKVSTAPGNGSRWRADILLSPRIGSGVDFVTYSADWRKYFAVKNDYSFAFRVSGARSSGANPQRFYMGGVGNWFNPRFDNPDEDIIIDDIEDIYFARFATPLKGVGLYNQIGTRYLLTNFEFRFPAIRHLVLGWPLPAYFRDIRGALFADFGTAWSRGRENDLADEQLLPDFEDWSYGYGVGMRFDLGIFPLEWDIAWSPESNFAPQYYLSLNVGF